MPQLSNPICLQRIRANMNTIQSKVKNSMYFTLFWITCACVLNYSRNYSDVIMSTMAYPASRLFRRRSKKTSKFRVTGLCEGNSPVTGEFPAQRASNAENVSIWWRHHVRWLISCKGVSIWNRVIQHVILIVLSCPLIMPPIRMHQG